MIYTLPEAVRATVLLAGIFVSAFEEGVVAGAVGMWKSPLGDFQGAVGNVGNRSLVFQIFHGPGISTALAQRPHLSLSFVPWLRNCLIPR
jgi:hypothetical protein